MDRKDHKTAVFIAGDKEEQLQAMLAQDEITALREHGLIERRRLAHVGFAWLPDRLIVVLPKAYSEGEIRNRLKQHPDYALEQGFLLIRTLSKCRQDGRFQTLYEQEQPLIEHGLSPDDKELSALEAAIELRRDYLLNGLYWNKSTRVRENYYSAPIDWKRTIQLRQPVLDGPDILWYNTIHSNRSRDPLDYLHRLHAYCISNILGLTGEASFAPHFLPLSDGEQTELASAPARIIDFHLSRTYQDRGKNLLLLIKSWLLGVSISTNPSTAFEPILLAARSFERIWEHLLRSLLDDPKNKPALQKGMWINKNGIAGDGIKPVIDLFRVEEGDQAPYGDVFLFDAKDKRLSQDAYTGSANDHYKQLIYRQLLEKRYRGSRFFNVLLFPSVRENDVVEIEGIHYWPSIFHSQVLEASIDYVTVSQAWLHEKEFDANHLVDKIRHQFCLFRLYRRKHRIRVQRRIRR